MSQGAHPLDRQIWGALTSRQAPLALGGPLAKRLDPVFGPFAATRDDTPESFAALHALALAHGPLVLFTPEPPPLPAGFEVLLASSLDQFVGTAPLGAGDTSGVVPLGPADLPEMLALTELTKPGPFLARTPELGAFVGVRINGRLAAMAGERLKPDGFTEVTAVCTHPDFRGRGLGAKVIRAVAAIIEARGETPFLHVFSHNAAAIAVYRALGMTTRRKFAVTFAKGA